MTTLMRPQPPSAPSLLGATDSLARHDRLFGDDKLTNSNTLANEDLLSGQRPATGRPADPTKPGAQDACDSRTAENPAAAPAAGMGGSGPGEYARFVDPGRGSGSAAPAARTPERVPGDHALYGGTDRPLWSDGAPGPAGKPAQRATASRQAHDANATGDAPASVAPSETRAAPTPGVDRPLWADAVGMGGTTVDPCGGGTASQRAGVKAPPVQTLFFGTAPAR